MSNNFQMGHCEDCVMHKREIAHLKGRIEQLEKEKANLYDRCLENRRGRDMNKNWVYDDLLGLSPVQWLVVMVLWLVVAMLVVMVDGCQKIRGANGHIIDAEYEVPLIKVFDVCEIIPRSAEAIRAIEEVSPWTNH